MFVFEIFRVAMSAIRANVLRTVLTTLGIVIGVAAVIAVVALGEGAQQRVQSIVQSIGTNVLTVRPGTESFGGVRDYSKRLYVKDAEALKDESDGLLTVAPQEGSGEQVRYLRWNAHFEVVGTWPEYSQIYHFHILVGRFFNESEVRGRRRVAVLGYNVMQDLGDRPPASMVGKRIEIRGLPFDVIGVIAEKGESLFLRPDEQIFIPLSTGQYRVFGGWRHLEDIYAAAPTAGDLGQAYAAIDRIMRHRHRIRPGGVDDFNIRDTAALLSAFNSTNQTLTYLLAGIAAVSLLVGGIGIMNIMLVSVTERTREIGIRKALGATRGNIMLQFLVESLALCVLGGLLGVGVGYGSAYLITRLATWRTYVAPVAVFIALGFSAGVGLFFGIWPARRAASLDPIVALRYE